MWTPLAGTGVWNSGADGPEEGEWCDAMVTGERLPNKTEAAGGRKKSREIRVTCVDRSKGSEIWLDDRSSRLRMHPPPAGWVPPPPLPPKPPQVESAASAAPAALALTPAQRFENLEKSKPFLTAAEYEAKRAEILNDL